MCSASAFHRREGLAQCPVIAKLPSALESYMVVAQSREQYDSGRCYAQGESFPSGSHDYTEPNTPPTAIIPTTEAHRCDLRGQA